MTPSPAAPPVRQVQPAGPGRRVRPWLGPLLLSLSAAGTPLVIIVLQRFGRPGGLAVTAGCGVLLARDAAMTVTGTPARLLLLAEVATSGTAVCSGLRAWGWQRSGPEWAATAAATATFTLHTARMAIYLSPDHGRRGPAPQ